MKNNFLKRTFSALAICGIIGLPTLAYASSYSTDFYFDVSLKGATRSYTGNNLSIKTSCTTSSTGTVIPASSDFAISLTRQRTFGQDYIGRVDHPRNSTKTSTFSNVGSGKYFFSFTKANDEHRTRGTATMFN